MFDDARFRHVYDQLADVGHVIADPLEMLGDQEQSRRAAGGVRVARHVIEQIMEDPVVEPIDLVILPEDAARGIRVSIREGIELMP